MSEQKQLGLYVILIQLRLRKSRKLEMIVKDVMLSYTASYHFWTFMKKYTLKIRPNCDPFWTFFKPLWYCMSWLFCSTMTSASALVGGR